MLEQDQTKQMQEEWDVYDKKRHIIGSMYRKDIEQMKVGEYHIVVTAIIMNESNQILISQRAPNKQTKPLKWECNGGSVLKGESSLQGVVREIKEELGITLYAKEAMFVTTMQREEKRALHDIWLFKKEIDLKEIVFSDQEAVDAKWVTIEEFLDMYEQDLLLKSMKAVIDNYEKILEMKPRKSYAYIGKEVTVKVDRPLGSKHPTQALKYPVNYGYIPNTKSEDGEELDAYILGVEEAVEEWTGICIAVIYRLNDYDDKLIVVPKGKTYTNEEIREQIKFQEQYFISEIIR